MRSILAIIVFSQFFCTSLWFAGNAIISDIARDLHLSHDFLAYQTSAIQFGFISGTLIFALFTISDRYSPSSVFFWSSVLAAAFNLGISLHSIDATELLLFRFLTGFFLAGIYPVGMKIASDYFQSGLGRSLGFLVGALVIGTAFPHLLRDLVSGLPYKYVVYGTSALSILGGLCIILFVPDGPYRKVGQKLKLSTFTQGFRLPAFRSAAFGYFGHMWELYTFWAFVPLMLLNYNTHHVQHVLNVPLMSFLIIASGGPACVVGGFLSQQFGAKSVATSSLVLSCTCCLVSPFFLQNESSFVLLCFLFFWAWVVIADSPLFSTLIAQSAPEIARGTALTIVNCIGFFITILSIQFINAMGHQISQQYIYMLLAIGPVLGLIALVKGEKINWVRNGF
ncbi:MAG: MFS transporter [bacterium]|nr:MFS transporter [bacterium]